MKKVIFSCMMLCIAIVSCDKQETIDEVIVSQQSDTSYTRNSQSNPDVAFLQSQGDFNTAALVAIGEINSFLQSAQSSINLSGLVTENGYLVFSDAESFKQVYENIETVDEEYQVFLDNKYDALLGVAM